MKKIIELKTKEQKSKNTKKIIIGVAISIIVIVSATAVGFYYANDEFRNFIDKYILFKNVSEENLPAIEIDYTSNTNVIPYGKYICVLAENTLFEYNFTGKEVNQVKIEVTNPVYDSNSKYLAIGEKNNKKLYLINGERIIWEKNIEGNLNKVTVNKNGYVSAIVTGTSYKSVIITYDEKGNELFKSYLSSIIAVDSCISPDNSTLAYAEVNTSGTVIQSSVKIISIEEAKETNTEPKFTYSAPQNSLIIRIKYQEKGQLVCMYENSIHSIQNDEDTEIFNLNENEKEVDFADIKLNNCIFRAYEQSTGLFQADTVVEIKNIANQKEAVYTVKDIAKSIKSYENIIAINLGTEVVFINTNGNLVRHYTSSQTIRNIVIGDGLAGIIYRDKIELIIL